MTDAMPRDRTGAERQARRREQFRQMRLALQSVAKAWDNADADTEAEMRAAMVLVRAALSAPKKNPAMSVDAGADA